MKFLVWASKISAIFASKSAGCEAILTFVNRKNDEPSNFGKI